MPAPPMGHAVPPLPPPDDPALQVIPHPPATSSSVATTTGVRLPVDVIPSACLGAITTLAAAGDRTPAVVLPSTSQGSIAKTAAPGVRFSATAPLTGLGLVAASAGSRIRALVSLPQRLSSFAFRSPWTVPPIRLAASRVPPGLFRLILSESPSACRPLLRFSPPALQLYAASGFTTDDDRTQARA